jgi:hypothetical protein
MLGKQTIVMHAEFGVLDHGALARPTVPHQRSTARKRLHEEMVRRTYVRARARKEERRWPPVALAITPTSLVAVLREGWHPVVPLLHPSATRR